MLIKFAFLSDIGYLFINRCFMFTWYLLFSIVVIDIILSKVKFFAITLYRYSCMNCWFNVVYFTFGSIIHSYLSFYLYFEFKTSMAKWFKVWSLDNSLSQLWKFIRLLAKGWLFSVDSPFLFHHPRNWDKTDKSERFVTQT